MIWKRAAIAALGAMTMTTTAAADEAERANTFEWSVRPAKDGTLTAALAGQGATQFRARCDAASGDFVLDLFNLEPDRYTFKPNEPMGFTEVWDGDSPVVMMRTRLTGPNRLQGRIPLTPRLLKVLSAPHPGLIAPGEMGEREPLDDSGALAKVAGSCRPLRKVP